MLRFLIVPKLIKNIFVDQVEPTTVTPIEVTPNVVTPNVVTPNVVTQNVVTQNVVTTNVVTPNKGLIIPSVKIYRSSEGNSITGHYVCYFIEM